MDITVNVVLKLLRDGLKHRRVHSLIRGVWSAVLSMEVSDPMVGKIFVDLDDM